MTDIRVNSWMFRSPTVTASTSGLSRAPLHTGHGAERHVLLDPLALLRRVGLPVAALEARDDALEREHVRALAAHPVAVLDVDALAVRAVEEEVLLLLGQLVPRRRRGRSRSGRRSPGSPTRRSSSCRPTTARARPRAIESDGSGTSRSGSISCCAPRPVQRGQAPCGELKEKMRGCELGQRDAVVRAGEVLARRASARRRRRRSTTSPSASAGAVSTDCASRCAQVGLHHEPVDDDLDRVLELLVEDDLLLEQPLLAVDLHAREALARSSSRTSLYSPLRSRTTGALTVNCVPSGERAAPGRRSPRATGRRSAGRRPGSAAGRRARRGGAGSRRSR